MTKKPTHGGRRKGAGRPPSEDPRKQIVNVKLTEAEKLYLDSWAMEADMPLGAWMRETCLKVTKWK
jgi:hypothetical protein